MCERQTWVSSRSHTWRIQRFVMTAWCARGGRADPMDVLALRASSWLLLALVLILIAVVVLSLVGVVVLILVAGVVLVGGCDCLDGGLGYLGGGLGCCLGGGLGCCLVLVLVLGCLCLS